MLKLVIPKNVSCESCDDLKSLFQEKGVKFEVIESEEPGAYPQVYFKNRALGYAVMQKGDRIFKGLTGLNVLECKRIGGRMVDDICVLDGEEYVKELKEEDGED